MLRVWPPGETYLLNQEAQTPRCDVGPFVPRPFSIFWALQIMGRVLAFLLKEVLEKDSLKDLGNS